MSSVNIASVESHLPVGLQSSLTDKPHWDQNQQDQNVDADAVMAEMRPKELNGR